MPRWRVAHRVCDLHWSLLNLPVSQSRALLRLPHSVFERYSSKPANGLIVQLPGHPVRARHCKWLLLLVVDSRLCAAAAWYKFEQYELRPESELRSYMGRRKPDNYPLDVAAARKAFPSSKLTAASKRRRIADFIYKYYLYVDTKTGGTQKRTRADIFNALVNELRFGR